MFHKTSDEAHNFYKRKSRALDMEPLKKMENEWPKSKSPLMPKHNKSSQDDLHRLPAFSKIFFFQTVNKDTKENSIGNKSLKSSRKEHESDKSVILDSEGLIEGISAIPVNKERSDSTSISLNNSFKS